MTNKYGFGAKPKRNLVLTTALFLSTVAFIFAPFQTTQHTYEWIPAKDGNSVRLSLLELNPDSFRISFPCFSTIDSKQWIFEAKGGPAFLVEADKNYFYFTTGIPQSETLVLNKVPRLLDLVDCESVVIYDSKLEALQIFQGEQSDVLELAENTQFYFSSYTQWNSEIDSKGFELEVKTKYLIDAQKGLIKLLMLSILVFLLIVSFKNIIFEMFQSKKKIKIKSVAFLKSSILVALIAAFFVPPMADDGLYLVEAKVLAESSILMQYQYPVVFPTGQFHALINGIFSGLNYGIFYYRIIPSIVLILIWILIDSIIKTFTYIDTRMKLLVFCLWILFVFSFGMTLRPEPYVVLIFLGLILVILKYSSKNIYIPFCYSVLASSTSLALHQSGFVVLAASVSLWIYLILSREVFNFRYESLVKLFSLSVLIFFFHSSFILYFQRYLNFERVLDWPQPFTGEFRWVYPPLYEYMRIIHLKLASPSQVLLVVLIFFILTLLLIYSNTILKNYRKSKLGEFLIYLAIISSPLGLILAPSKWAAHYAALFPLLILGLLLLSRTNQTRLYLYMSIAFFSSLTYFLPWKNGGSDTINLDNNFAKYLFPDILWLRSYLPYLFLSALFILAILYIKNMSLSLNYFVILVVPAILLSPILQISPSAIDSLYSSSGWTLPRQVFNSLNTSSSNCGFFDSKDLQRNGIDIENKTFIFSNENYVHYECLNPTLPKNGIWQYPNFSVGGVPVWDQQRLANQSKIEKVYCPTFIDRSFKDEIDRCIYEWTSNIPNMTLVNSESFLIP
jgi:hypothetical protein